MKLLIIFVYISLLFNDPILANGNKTLEQTLVDDKIYSSFRLMYLQLSYISHYMSRRSTAIRRDKIDYIKPNQQIIAIGEKIFQILGTNFETQLPYRTSSLDLRPNVIPTDLEPYKNLPNVEKSIKESLEQVVKLYQIWSEHFEVDVFGIEYEINRDKNTNIYRLLYNDFLFIFFDVVKAIYDTYEIKYDKVKPQEVFAKEIYVSGLKSFSMKETFVSLGGELGIIELTKRAREANVDLIERMLNDITKQLKDLPPQIETLNKLFNQYKIAFQALN